MDESKIIQDASLLEQNKNYIKQVNKKVQPEDKTIKYVLELAKLQGSDGEARKIFDRYDRLLMNCSNQVERKHISVMGIAELHRLLNVQGALVVNGVEILPAIGEIKEIIY